MLKLFIGGAIGFGIAYVVFQRPQDRAVAAAQRMWSEMSRAVPPGTDPAQPTPKLQGFGYSRH